ncbi:MAG TPA: hypothetical protein VGR70_17835 [Stellaceae bacterium]|nr:hypothetical protein [Stellaceae bacterium]
MPESRRHKSQPAKELFLRRLDRMAENLNPVLIAIIIGLTILDVSVFAALELRKLPLRQISDTSDAVSTGPLTLGDAIGLPRR